MKSTSRRQLMRLTAGLGVSVLALAACSSTGSTQTGSAPGGAASVDADRDATIGIPGDGTFAEFVKEHPGLNQRSMPIAFVREKLEGGGELVNGPAQEDYSSRAFPRTAIGDAQVKAALAAYNRALTRGTGATVNPLAATARRTLSAPTTSTASFWEALGPFSGTVPAPVTYTGAPSNVSGRSTSLAIAPGCTVRICTLYIGTAGGGVWRTRNALAARPTYTSIGSQIPSTAIGSVYLDPSDRSHQTLYVGTGDADGSSDSEAGVGLYRSTNGGATFSVISGFTNFSKGRAIGAVVVDPKNSRHLLVGTAVARHGSSSVNGGRFTPAGAPTIGVYESFNRGATWRLTLKQDADVVDPTSPNGKDFFAAGASQIKLDPRDPSTVYAAINAYGVYRRVGTNGTWKQIYATPNQDSIDSRISFDVVTLRDGKTRMYLGDATAFVDEAAQVYRAGLFRSDNSRQNTPTFKSLSSPTPGTPGFGSYNFCQGQCSYDMKVTANPRDPNLVMLSGSMNYDEIFTSAQPSNGRAVVRSVDAGVSVTDMTNDIAKPANGLHPDHHDLVFVPGSTTTFFTASDGGIVRQSGPYRNRSADCATRGLAPVDLIDCEAWLSAIPSKNAAINIGLNTLQFQSLSLSQQNPGGFIQGGTQDNGTWAWSGSKNSWFESVGGDGGQSGFDPSNDSVRFHTYYGPTGDVNFNGADPLGWNYVTGPIDGSGEAASFYVPMITDPVTGGQVFLGASHVWRTQDNGGDSTFLKDHCNELTGDQFGIDGGLSCGDWKPLGGAAGDLSGGDRANYIVSVERGKDTSTMWVATRKGSLWVSKNADAANPGDVTFVRVDTGAGLPGRFVSGIHVDRDNANRAVLSYSGYSAYKAGGHVFDVVFDGTSALSSVTDLSYDLGDQPILDIVKDRITGSLFAGTDFGVVELAAGSTTWVASAGLPKVATYGLTLGSKDHVLYAATHGRGIWRVKVA